jgi:hypothetical protein
MAKNNKAFISLGKIDRKKSNGTTVAEEEYLIIPEANAKFIGARYTLDTPKPITVKVSQGKLKGREYTKEYTTTISGTKHQLGFENGTKIVKNKVTVKIKFISFFVPRFVSTRLFLTLIFSKITKNPVVYKSPAGVTVRLKTKT